MKQTLLQKETALLNEAQELLHKDAEESALKVIEAHETIMTEPGFKRIDPEYKQAVSFYKERIPHLISSLLNRNLELEDKYSRLLV